MSHFNPEAVRLHFKEFRRKHRIEKATFIIDHEGVVLPYGFHRGYEQVYSDAAIKNGIKHLPTNELFVRLLQVLSSEPETYVVSGSHIDAKTTLLPQLPLSFYYGLEKGHRVMSAIDGNFLTPAEPIPAGSALIFINDCPHAIWGFAEHLEKVQPGFDTFTSLEMIVPAFRFDNSPDYETQLLSTMLHALAETPKPAAELLK